ncbi:short-chain dehydrogenase, partial [Myxococcota bacterium]|nr:short-chain dehydrogenase [Myxococcota bacterium]
TEEVREARSPKWIAPIVTWLASTESRGITGRVFEANGKLLAVAEGWERGPTIPAIADPTDIGSAVAALVSQARLNSGMNGKGQDGGVS